VRLIGANVDATSTFVTNEAACEALSVDDFAIAKLVVNPASSYFQISHWQELESITLYDVTGKKVKSFNPRLSAFSVHGIVGGIYFLKIKTTKGFKTERLIIR